VWPVDVIVLDVVDDEEFELSPVPEERAIEEFTTQ
jgi:hypothetical protein